MLVQCDPSIKSIIVSIDSERNDFIIEDLDDSTVVVKENMLAQLKAKLDDVSPAPALPGRRDSRPADISLFLSLA